MELSKQSSFAWLITGAILAAMGVGLGAFGAHGLEKFATGQVVDLEKSIEYWTTASRYWLIHALGIAILGLTSAVFGRRLTFDLAGAFFVVGILLFSGCLYVLALTDIRVLGAIVPLGGLSMIVGWLTFAAGLMQDTK